MLTLQSVAVGTGAGGGRGRLRSDHRSEGALLFNCREDRGGRERERERGRERVVQSERPVKVRLGWLWEPRGGERAGI